MKQVDKTVYMLKGKRYVAEAPTEGPDTCAACAFKNLMQCFAAPPCTAGSRKDRRDIIWKEEKKHDEPVRSDEV